MKELKTATLSAKTYKLKKRREIYSAFLTKGLINKTIVENFKLPVL